MANVPFCVVFVSMIVIILVIEFGILIPTLVTPTEMRLEEMKSTVINPVNTCMNWLVSSHTQILRTTLAMMAFLLLS